METSWKGLTEPLRDSDIGSEWFVSMATKNVGTHCKSQIIDVSNYNWCVLVLYTWQMDVSIHSLESSNQAMFSQEKFALDLKCLLCPFSLTLKTRETN